MDIQELNNDLDVLCEKHSIYKEELRIEMQAPEMNDIQVGCKSYLSPDGSMRHSSIIKTECRDSVSIFVEFKAKEITMLDGRRYEVQ